MLRVGLKLWSTNVDYYLEESVRLFNDGKISYIELYYVPGTMNLSSKWEALEVPFIVHAPHYAHGINLADKSKLKYNMKEYSNVIKFADKLDAKYIIAHSEVNGSIEETARQLNLIGDKRILIENVPAIVEEMDDIVKFVGVTPKEIEYIINESGVGFVFDTGHCIAAANYFNIDYWSYINEFLRLKPDMYHISDTDTNTPFDDHLNIGFGNLDFSRLLKIINIDKMMSLETRKKSKNNLLDFEKDVEKLLSISRDIKR